jgi:hypothetical protein
MFLRNFCKLVQQYTPALDTFDEVYFLKFQIEVLSSYYFM